MRSAAAILEMEKFRTGRLLARSWQIEDLPLAMQLWGDPAVTALIDSRGKLTEAQVHEPHTILSRELAGTALGIILATMMLTTLSVLFFLH
jgi:hypothetical protein